MDDYARFRARERRRRLLWAILAWAIVLGLAALTAFVLWMTVVGISVVFG